MKATNRTAAPVAGGRGSRLTRGDIGLLQVSLFAWRAYDRRVPESDPSRLLGFIEERDGRFELMQLGHGFQWSTFDSMRAALAHIVRTAPKTIADRLGGELAWIS